MARPTLPPIHVQGFAPPINDDDAHGHPGVPCSGAPYEKMPERPTTDSQKLETGAVRSEIYHQGARFPIRYDLMMRNTSGMRRLAEVWGEGNMKYGPDNWMHGFPESVLIQHAFDHIVSYLQEGNKHEDNLGHAVWNLLVLMWVEENKPQLLDLTKVEQEP